MKTKFRIYALFQFMSFLALMSFLAAAILLIYQGAQTSKVDSEGFWNEALSDTLQFTKLSSIGVLASIFIYITFFLWIFTWVIGLLLVRIKNRNLFDSLFLMFAVFPLISNIFALFGQLSLKTQDYTSASIDKKKIQKETEKLLKEERAKS